MKISLNKITVKENRRNVNESKVSELSESIKELGLLNPITVEENNGVYFLIAGAHRLNAVKKLGHLGIECNVVSFENSLLSELAEIDENLVRNELHYIDRSDELSKRKRIYEQLYPETKHGGDRKSDKIKLQNLQLEKPTFIEDTSKKTNESNRSIYQSITRAEKIIPEAKQVIKEKDFPKFQADALAKMNEDEQRTFVKKVTSGEVKNVTDFENIKKKEEREKDIERQKKDIETAQQNQPKKTNKKYASIVLDPPWMYGRAYDPKGSRVANPYPEMSQEQLKALEIPAMDDTVMFLWTTHKFLFDAKELMDHWGFDYKATLVWNKEKIGMGHWFRMQCEFCLFGVKGKPIWDNTSIRDIITEPRREHSRKPEGFYDMVEEVSVGEIYEFFARTERERFVSFGNETDKFKS
ncbi:MAG: Spo0J and IME4 domain-containing protein [Mesonia sp.]|uniref:Spo0J and IME4 domain-containing protein n=1 Tax=Mesonia sp. TaxID=1960830 RepID=UPI003F9A0429